MSTGWYVFTMLSKEACLDRNRKEKHEICIPLGHMSTTDHGIIIYSIAFNQKMDLTTPSNLR